MARLLYLRLARQDLMPVVKVELVNTARLGAAVRTIKFSHVASEHRWLGFRSLGETLMV